MTTAWQWFLGAPLRDFLVDQFHLDAINVHKAIHAVADSWQRPPGTVNDVLDRLDRAGLPQTAAVLRR